MLGFNEIMRGEYRGVRNAELDNARMRHAAYRAATMYRHGYLGAGNRQPVPSCCVLSIRRHFPDPSNHYTGYLAGRVA